MEFWRERAHNRRARLIERGYTSAYANEQLQKDHAAARNLAKLVDWCGKRGLEVLFTRHENGTYDEIDKIILIAANALPEKQVFYLIHECGHHLIHQHPGNPNRFELGYDQTDPEILRRFDHRLACLEEEIEAWQRGRNLARKLRLKLDEEALNQLRVHCLHSYTKWACKKGKYE